MRYTVEIGEGRTEEVEITRLGPERFQYRVGNGPLHVVEAGVAAGLVHLLQGDRSHVVRLGARGEGRQAHVGGRELRLEVQDERKRRHGHAGAGGAEGRKVVRSPMPGKVVKVLVEEGQAVTAGQGVIIVEAMKMENELKAPGPGLVKQILVKAGDRVEGNAELVVIEAAGATP